MSKFTQEPWRLLPPAFPHAPYTIQTTVHETGPGCWACETIASVDSEANGRLIVAAPAMYELLKLCIETLDEYLPFECGASKVSKRLLARIDGEEDNE